MPNKVLLTGSAGFIGSHLLARLLSDTDWNVVCLDRLDSAGNLGRLQALPEFNLHRSRVEVVFHDLRAVIVNGAAKRVLTGNGRFDDEVFDDVIHLAAGSHVDRSVTDPTGFVLDNVLGTAHLLDFARHAARRTLIFSTDEVFGAAATSQFEVPGRYMTYGEADRMNPLNPYAASKAGAELLAPAYANTYGMKIRVTRCANVFGERQDPEKFVPLVIRKVLAGETVGIHFASSPVGPPHPKYWPEGFKSGISSTRCYTHHRNVTSAVLKILEAGDFVDGYPPHGYYNIEGGEEVPNYEVVEKVAALLGREGLWEHVENPPGRPRPDMRYSLDSSRLRELGWKPELSFAEGLRRTVRYEAAIAGHLLADEARAIEAVATGRFEREQEDG